MKPLESGEALTYLVPQQPGNLAFGQYDELHNVYTLAALRISLNSSGMSMLLLINNSTSNQLQGPRVCLRGQMQTLGGDLRDSSSMSIDILRIPPIFTIQ
jgi:hypothetical protein